MSKLRMVFQYEMSDGYREVEQMKAEQAKKSMESLKALTTNKSIRNRLERERYRTEPVHESNALSIDFTCCLPHLD